MCDETESKTFFQIPFFFYTNFSIQNPRLFYTNFFQIQNHKKLTSFETDTHIDTKLYKTMFQPNQFKIFFINVSRPNPINVLIPNIFNTESDTESDILLIPNVFKKNGQVSKQKRDTLPEGLPARLLVFLICYKIFGGYLVDVGQKVASNM